jgi:hypothetical protein
MDHVYSQNTFKLQNEQRSSAPVVAEAAATIPMDQDRYNLILREMHEAKLKELQSAHDSALYEVQSLKQKQQSGTQQHLVVSEKRRLASLIGKTQRARNQLLNKMTPYVRYIVDNTEHHTIPAIWKQQARDGAPYWIEANEESVTTPSIAEKNSIVESYLKRQRAWEQVTVIVPRETVDAMKFFGDVEQRSFAFINGLPGQPDHGQSSISRETHQYNLGCLVVYQDVWVKARECRLKCRRVWNSIETELQSDQIIEVTNVSGGAGGIPADRKVNAMLPFLQLSQGPGAELLREHVAVGDSLQEHHTLGQDHSEEQEID